MKPKPAVLLVEKIHPTFMAKLEKKARVVRPLAHDEATLASVAGGEKVDAIVIRTSGCVSRRVIEASPNLKVVARHGIGVEHIDIPAATERGVWVVNTPGASRVAASEHTWAMILALAKKITWGDRAVRSGNFVFRNHNKALQLEGKTLGIIGLGRIGSTVGEIAVRAFGMKLLYTDLVKYPGKERLLSAKKVPLRTLLSKSDIVSIHTPLDESTRGLIAARELAWMQPHAFLVNCARGAIVDAAAVAKALTADKLGGAAFDVFDPEVPGSDHPLLNCDRAVLSPHFAAQTPEANVGYAAVVDDVLRVLAGKRPQWPLNEVKAARNERG
ncbi:MAG TPA: hydroxyacid dehydrogenase [Planctomycetota bacterium]|nr:hydroxyacid dehydrogenase [Planctomycetota bacterium]